MDLHKLIAELLARKNDEPQDEQPHLPLPKPNFVRRLPGEDGPWAPEHAIAAACDPCWAGVGPYEAVVEEEWWIRSAAEYIRMEGAEQFLVNMLGVLREEFQNAVIVPVEPEGRGKNGHQ